MKKLAIFTVLFTVLICMMLLLASCGETTKTPTKKSNVTKKPAQVKVEDGVVSQAPKASSTAATQLAAVAQFVAMNSTIFWILGLLAVLIGFRRFMNKYEIVNVPQTPQKSVPPEKKGK